MRDERKKILDLMKKLEALRKSGTLTEEEYEEKMKSLREKLAKLEQARLGKAPTAIRPIVLVALIMLSIATVVLIASCIHLNNQYNALYEEYGRLQNTYMSLDGSYKELKGKYDVLDEQYNRLEEKYDSLVKTKEELGAELSHVKSEYNALMDSYNDLKQQFETISTEYEKLKGEHDSLKRNLEEVQVKYNEAQSSAQQWKTKYESLHQKYSELELTNKMLTQRVNELEENVNELETLLKQYEQVPHGYYETDLFHSDRTAGDIINVLRQAHQMLARDYKEDVFDCSESAAFIEWVMEDAGYDARIAVGPAPWDPEAGYHAWVIVYTKDGYVAAIEPTITTRSLSIIELELLSYGIIYGNDEHAEGYYEGYDHLFKNIYYAIRHCKSVEEWNWWEGYWGFT